MDEDLGYLCDQCIGQSKENCFVYPLSSPEEHPASSSIDFLEVPLEALEERVRPSLGQRRDAQGPGDQEIP